MNKPGYMEKWKEENKEHYREYYKKYHEDNHEKRNKYSKQWRKDNPGYQKQYNKQWRKINPEKMKESIRKWEMNHSEKTREIMKRHYVKKNRNLGFNPLNEYFEGAIAHHINRIDVIYIPEELHKSISHRLKTGKNMEEINKLAMNYLLEGI